MITIRFPLEERMDDRRPRPPRPADVVVLHPTGDDASGYQPIVDLLKRKPKVCPRCHGSQVVGMTMRACPVCQ